MGKTNSKQRNSKSDVDLRTSTLNLSLNIIIFLLGALIIYMSYSIVINLSDKVTEVRPEQTKEVAGNIIQLEVLNGCGVTGVADRFTDYLRNNNFDVVNVDNYISYDVSESLVIDRIGNMANARKVAKSLGIKSNNVIQQLNKNYFLDVTVVIGKDYFNLAPLK